MGRGVSKRAMEVRISQHFCRLLQMNLFQEALDFGREHADFIRGDQWSTVGGGMVETALFSLCHEWQKQITQPPQLLMMEPLVDFLLHELGGDRWINRVRHTAWGVHTPLTLAIVNHKIDVIQTLIKCSKSIDLSANRALEVALNGSTEPRYYIRGDFSTIYTLLKQVDKIVIDPPLNVLNLPETQVEMMLVAAREKIDKRRDHLILTTIGPLSISPIFLPKELVSLILEFVKSKAPLFYHYDSRGTTDNYIYDD